ncbi:uncharacterized protein [Coffea arabica]|uniref:Uncharacterized protein n=1 Tax=Coffea arabica TaxID=13443 RepID=A0A6P6WX05_COFAR|nr:uncharacterized protein LOC113736926 [Coffea arabica]
MLRNSCKRLKSLEAASSPLHSLACQKLDCVKRLYECLDDLLQLPSTQQSLYNERLGKLEEGVLDRSLRLLDICRVVRDIYSQMKESIQELESSLRRKRSGDLSNKLDLLNDKKSNKEVIKKLEAVDSSIEELAEMLEIVFRLLLKSRVSFSILSTTRLGPQSAWSPKYHAPQFCIHYPL